MLHFDSEERTVLEDMSEMFDNAMSGLESTIPIPRVGHYYDLLFVGSHYYCFH